MTDVRGRADFRYCARCFAPASLEDLEFRCNTSPPCPPNPPHLRLVEAEKLHVDARQAYAPCIRTGCNRIRSNLHVVGCSFAMGESLVGARQTELVLSVGSSADLTMKLAACCLVLSLREGAGQTPQVSAVGSEAIALWTVPQLLRVKPQLAYRPGPKSTLSFLVGDAPPRTLNLRLFSVSDPEQFEDRLFSARSNEECIQAQRANRGYDRKSRLANISRVHVWMSAKDALSAEGRAAISSATEAICRSFEPQAARMPLIVGLIDDDDYFGALGPGGAALANAYGLPIEERERVLDDYVLRNFRLANIAERLLDSFANVATVVVSAREMYDGTLRGLDRWRTQVRKGT